MEIFDKAGKAVGDVVAKARERERIRVADRLALLDAIDASARIVVVKGTHRPGYNWKSEATEECLKMVSASLAIDDADLTARVDALCAIDVPYDGPSPYQALGAAHRELAVRLGEVRRATLADD
jgi:hypothetical protein